MKHWASYQDLLEIDKELLSKATEAAGAYCYDAVNLVFEHQSTTSGMYGTWRIGVSLSCTVNMTMRAPRGVGGHFNEALQSFIDDCEKTKSEFELKQQQDALAQKPLDEKLASGTIGKGCSWDMSDDEV